MHAPLPTLAVLYTLHLDDCPSLWQGLTEDESWDLNLKAFWGAGEVLTAEPEPLGDASEMRGASFKPCAAALSASVLSLTGASALSLITTCVAAVDQLC